MAEKIYQRTGGQPYLIQLYGSLLVSLLNRRDPSERVATLDDLKNVEEDVLTQATYYFRQTVQSAPKEVSDILEALALGQPVTISKSDRRWLNRRALLTKEDKISIPVLERWICEY